MLVLERDAPRKTANLLSDLAHGFTGLRSVFVGRRALGLMSLGLVSYGATITIRGLWLVPMFVERHGFSLIAAGNVALAVSIGMIIAPAIIGRLDPGDAGRRWAVSVMAYALGLSIAALAFSGSQPVWVDIALCILFSILSAYFVLAYSEVRSAYPPELMGRGLTGFNMIMFFGAALAQSISGVVASAAQAHGWNGINAVLVFLAVSLTLGTTGFVIFGRGRISSKPMP
jgi:MFS family permease